MQEPVVSVGILNAARIQFELNGAFHSPTGVVTGLQEAVFTNGRIIWQGNSYDELSFLPAENATFTLKAVVIGIHFHWERSEDQTFTGELHIIHDNNGLWAINRLPVEDYLTSVISSEMSQHAGLELLKAHAIISRSWLLSQMEHKRHASASTCHETPERLIRWYDHDDHTLFDVCADDHCQRYQGITRATNPTVGQAIEATRGVLLMQGDEICDARFSKCCGGTMEQFSSCWEDKDYTYLVPKRDWIGPGDDAFCNTSNPRILHQILNNYDQETTRFYRWTVTYSAEQLSELVCRKSGTDYGEILDLIPVKRGPSGRIIELKIVGSKLTRIIGKELEIRRTLSESHLYSSAFTVEKKDGQFILHGKGWGHGVGLCQIGAAVMGDMGYLYDQILEHYYPNTQLIKKY
ncbi:MAG: SpoIID/LytB domain-containing protein [Bacteroidaceae bacterium]|nr:SpoIID/LytB domain-containing protein [Bacteroidaceae bacterium]